MDVRVKFLGGAQSVTGSKYVLDIDDFRLMVDCGLFQGLKELRLRNWAPFEIEPASVDAIILTHAHIDHTGYLPRLVKEGFSGPVYCTEATRDLLDIMLMDSAKLQEEEAEFARKKGYSRHENPQPLYNQKDVLKSLELLQPIRFKSTINISRNISLEFYQAGHILGAAIARLKLKGEQQTKEVVFSGDLGRYDNPMHEDPAAIKTADILFIESTYGNRSNLANNPEAELARCINDSMARKGVLMIPAFSVGRTQLILYYLASLFEQKSIPDIPVYLDSPMALSVTGLYKKHNECHKLDEFQLQDAPTLFDHPNFHYIREQDRSMALNMIPKDAIIISASGMCTGGRILHHLYHRLRKPQDTLLFVGYQGKGTRGGRILNGESEIKMFGELVPVNCHVESIDGLSAHADREELLRWAGQLISPPKMTFIVHGEKDASENFAQLLHTQFGYNTMVPNYMESYELFDSI